MKLSLSEEEFLHNFGDRQSSEFEVSWQLGIGRAVWSDLTTGDVYVVRYDGGE